MSMPCDMTVTKSTVNLLYFLHTLYLHYFRLNLDSVSKKTNENDMTVTGAAATAQ